MWPLIVISLKLCSFSSFSDIEIKVWQGNYHQVTYKRKHIFQQVVWKKATQLYVFIYERILLLWLSHETQFIRRSAHINGKEEERILIKITYRYALSLINTIFYHIDCRLR